MNSRQIVLAGLRNGAGAIGYIVCIVWFVTVGTRGMNEPSVLIPMMMLTLFVLSALIEGAIVLGQPILMFVQGERQDAAKVLATTVGFMFLCLLAFVALNLR